MRSLNYPEMVEKYIRLQCNGDRSLYENMPDTYLVRSIFDEKNPGRVIEIGAGLGRASVYFATRCGWNCEFHYIDGDSGDKQCAGVRQEAHGEYYNSHAAAKAFAEANDVGNIQMWHPESDWHNKICDADMAYSFLAIGFHWPVGLYLKQLRKCLRPGAPVVFGMRGLERFSWVAEQIDKIDQGEYKVLLAAIVAKQERCSVLVLEAA